MGGNSSGVSYGSERGNKAFIRHTLHCQQLSFCTMSVRNSRHLKYLLNYLFDECVNDFGLENVSQRYPTAQPASLFKGLETSFFFFFSKHSSCITCSKLFSQYAKIPETYIE